MLYRIQGDATLLNRLDKAQVGQSHRQNCGGLFDSLKLISLCV